MGYNRAQRMPAIVMGVLMGVLLSLVAPVVLASSVQRIITLSPHATELAFAAGLGPKLVGVSQASDYPPAAKTIERVANFKGINLDRIMALHPDLIISWPAGNSPQVISQLNDMGLMIYPASIDKLDDIAKHIRYLSQYADQPQTGRQAADAFMHRLQQLKRRYHDVSPVRYFYQLSAKPLITMAQGSWPSEVFSLCGGVNVFANSPSPYPQVGLEQVLLAHPQAMFSSHAGGMQQWKHWHNELSALHNQHVWTLNPDWLNRPTPRTLHAINQVCKSLDTVRKH